jgi:preprotein translocase subunit SecG
MIYLLYFIHIVISLFLIAIVLLQQGKGADLSVFGGGATQTAFGARGATTLLHKLTVGAFVGFIVTTLLIGIVQSRENAVTPLGALPEAEAAVPSETTPATPPADGAAAPATPPADGTGAPASGAPATAPADGAAAPATTPAESPASAPAEAPATPPAEAPAPPTGGSGGGN